MSDFSHIDDMLEMAAIIARHLEHEDIKVVLVGGLAVHVYTNNSYLTHDIDMVDTSFSTASSLKKSMAKIGFHKDGRVFKNKTSPFIVEFPSGPLGVGEDTPEIVIKRVGDKNLPVLSAPDMVKDRIAVHIHHGDNQGAIQAICIMLNHGIPLKAIQRYCLQEAGSERYYRFFSEIFTKARQKDLKTIESIQQEISTDILAWKSR